MEAALTALTLEPSRTTEPVSKQQQESLHTCAFRTPNQYRNVIHRLMSMSSASADGSVCASAVGSPAAALDDPLIPKVDSDTGATSYFIHPPESAATSLQSSTASLRGSRPIDKGIRGIKRNRKQLEDTQATLHQSIPVIQPFILSCPSPSPLTETRYKLAGEKSRRLSGRNTPYANARSLNTNETFRRTRDSTLDEQYDDEDISSPLDIPHSPNIREGLGNVIHRFAGVAGKVWQNWSSSFRGFYAGGGQGYDISALSQNPSGSAMWQSVQDDRFTPSGYDLPTTPGGFPQGDFIPDYMSQDHSQTPTRAAKRSKRTSNTTDTWVIIKSSPSRDPSPLRANQRKVPPSPGSSRRTASRPRRQPLRVSQSPQIQSAGGRGALDSARSPGKVASPSSVEMQRHAARLRRKEAEEEAHLQSFNMKLKAMIREGKEALDTKFEVKEYVDENQTRKIL